MILRETVFEIKTVFKNAAALTFILFQLYDSIIQQS